MKSIILCEGPTDGILLQYFMREVHLWEDAGEPEQLFKGRRDWARRLKKKENELDLVSCKGASKLLPCMDYFLDINKTANMSEAYGKLVVITDRDECGTEENFIGKAIHCML